MSKGITSGYVPLGAVGVREELYEQLLESETILPHGFTAGGHPVACAVALANIGIIEAEGLVENAAAVGEHLNQRLRELAERHEAVTSVRSLGMLGGFDLDGERVAGPEQADQAGSLLTAELVEAGVLVRPYGNTIVFGPALTTTPAEIDEIFGRFDSALARLST
jgi:putrescine aminotransferase